MMASVLLRNEVFTRVIQDEKSWDAIRDDWDNLHDASSTASPPLAYTWLRGWWHVYQPTLRPGSLRIITVWRAAHLIGALPLYIRYGRGGPLGVRRLGFISTGEAELEETCPDYMNLLCLPGEEVRCAAATWQAIGQMTWDHLDLLDLPDDTPLLHLERPFPDIQVFSRGNCPVADLAGGFDTYIGELSAKTRQHARQYIRAADRQRAVIELAGPTDVDQFFDDLVRLHQERWTAEGKPGCFAAARFSELHRYLAREWVPKGRAVLARLTLEGQVYVVLYGFVTASKFAFYQSGVRRGDTGPFNSPGTTANLLLMRELSKRGVTAYDFLRGSSSYKERLATMESHLIGVQSWRPTFRAAVYRSARFGERVVRKGMSFIKRPNP